MLRSSTLVALVGMRNFAWSSSKLHWWSGNLFWCSVNIFHWCSAKVLWCSGCENLVVHTGSGATLCMFSPHPTLWSSNLSSSTIFIPFCLQKAILRLTIFCTSKDDAPEHDFGSIQRPENVISMGIQFCAVARRFGLDCISSLRLGRSRRATNPVSESHSCNLIWYQLSKVNGNPNREVQVQMLLWNVKWFSAQCRQYTVINNNQI